MACSKASESDSPNVFKLAERFVCDVFTSREALTSMSLIGTPADISICVNMHTVSSGDKRGLVFLCSWKKNSAAEVIEPLNFHSYASSSFGGHWLKFPINRVYFPEKGYSSQQRRKRPV